MERNNPKLTKELRARFGDELRQIIEAKLGKDESFMLFLLNGKGDVNAIGFGCEGCIYKIVESFVDEARDNPPAHNHTRVH